MTWWARWDGQTLVIAQRPNGFVYFGVLAAWMMLAVVIAMGDAGILIGGLFLSMAVVMPGLVVYFRTTVRAASNLEVRRFRGSYLVSESTLRALSAHREMRRVSSRYGSGEMPFVILQVHTRDGRTRELMVIDDAEIDPPSWEALCKGLASLPYGTNRLTPPG